MENNQEIRVATQFLDLKWLRSRMSKTVLKSEETGGHSRQVEIGK